MSGFSQRKLMKLPELEKLLEYEHAAVLKLYEQNYPNNHLKAEQAFKETLKYLWLAKKHQLEFQDNQKNAAFPSECFMPRSMREIDEMWHEFILFTKDYMVFCDHYFGEYMHHLPNIFDNQPRARHIVEQDVEKLLYYIYENLGEVTVKTWFAQYLNE